MGSNISRHSPSRRLLGALAASVLVLASSILVSGQAGATTSRGVIPAGASTLTPPVIPTLVAIRAAHHPGFDRVVFQFDSSRPPPSQVKRVTRIIADGSGFAVPVPGRSILRVRFEGADAHTDAGAPSVALNQAFALPNIVATRGAGDFEGVVTVGMGLAKKEPFTVTRLANPGRVVVDVSTSFSRVNRQVLLFDPTRLDWEDAPAKVWVPRPVVSSAPAIGLLDRILAGPTAAERGRGITHFSSGVTGFSHVSVSKGIARLRLQGGCDRDGVFSIADHIIPTLKRLPTVRWVKISDSRGETMNPSGNRDSIPRCLR